jgi:hypothetical protein
MALRDCSVAKVPRLNANNSGSTNRGIPTTGTIKQNRTDLCFYLVS